MYCLNCGFQLTDDANFCSKCGRPQKPEEKAEKQIWETCEITWEEWEDPNYSPISAPDYRQSWGRFCALAVGPKGPYIAAATHQSCFSAYSTEEHQYERFPSEVNEEDFRGMRHQYWYASSQGAERFLRNFIEHLVADGWEQTETRGDKWYSYKFRRQA